MSELIYSIRDIFGSNDSTACLPQSNCSAFWIPAYQRGYKWGADGEAESAQPVDQLLHDLKQAWQNQSKEYLLQAITVKKVKDDEKGWVLEVIDGQQRLTTLFILLYALEFRLSPQASSSIATGKLLYSIRHKDKSLDTLVTRWLSVNTPPIGSFAEWEALQKAGEETHQDLAYLHRATLRCQYEFRSDMSKNDGSIAEFRTYLLNRVKLLVNRVEPHIEGEAIFAALNSNRVALTECELIKGVLLTRVARSPSSGQSRRYREILERRIQLGHKWDEIQHWASRKDTCSFYFAFKEEEESIPSIMRMLELATLQTSKNFYKPKTGRANVQYPLFNHIFELADPTIIFESLIATYARLRDWYETDATYHLLGYCLTDKYREERTSLLVKLLLSKTKTEARRELLKIRQKMLLGQFKKFQIDQLNYSEHAPVLKNIFLALSVFSERHQGRFDFYTYANENWSLEHIFPQTPFGKSASLSDEQIDVVLDFISSSTGLLGDAAVKEIAKLTKSPDLKSRVEEILKSVPILHTAGNLCLLIHGDNASMGCGMFNDKRRIIRERIAKGSFVPHHTYEVFSKMIVNNDSDLTVWSKPDVENHSNFIKQEIDKLINQTV